MPLLSQDVDVADLGLLEVSELETKVLNFFAIFRDFKVVMLYVDFAVFCDFQLENGILLDQLLVLISDSLGVLIFLLEALLKIVNLLLVILCLACTIPEERKCDRHFA